MTGNDRSNEGGSPIIDAIPEETIGQIIKSLLSGGIGNLQNEGRILLRRFFTRNAIFTAKVQQNERINIPQAEAEKLSLKKGDTVQVFLSPIRQQNDSDYECPDCHDLFASRTELLSHDCPEIEQVWGEV